MLQDIRTVWHSLPSVRCEFGSTDRILLVIGAMMGKATDVGSAASARSNPDEESIHVRAVSSHSRGPLLPPSLESLLLFVLTPSILRCLGMADMALISVAGTDTYKKLPPPTSNLSIP